MDADKLVFAVSHLGHDTGRSLNPHPKVQGNVNWDHVQSFLLQTYEDSGGAPDV